MRRPDAQYPSASTGSSASCVSFVYVINERSLTLWAAEKIECLHLIYTLQSSLSFLNALPPAYKLWHLPNLV